MAKPVKQLFSLHPENNGGTKQIIMKVNNANGQQVYTVIGYSDKNCRFGETFTPGIYICRTLYRETTEQTSN